MLSTIEKVIILRSVAMFSDVQDDELAGIASILREVHTHQGQEIVRKGDIGNQMFVIVSGQVAVHDGEKTLAILGEHDVFGELAALDPEPRMASVTAREDSFLLELGNSPLLDLMSEQAEVARGIIRFLCRRVRSAAQ